MIFEPNPFSSGKFDGFFLRLKSTACYGLAVMVTLWCPLDAAFAVGGASFDCAEVQAGAGSVEELICKDEALSTLDRKLASAYGAALKKAGNEHPPVLKAEQRGWIKGRNECWKSDSIKACVQDKYERRIAALQARYRLVPGTGPITYGCESQPGNEFIVTYFKTDPPTLIAERGDSVSLMYQQPSASGARYQGRNESLWEHQGEALITWGYEAPELRCKKAR